MAGHMVDADNAKGGISGYFVDVQSGIPQGTELGPLMFLM